MSWTRVTAPQPILDLEDVKAHLRVDFDDDDDLITGMIDAAVAHVDGPEGWLQRCLGPQVWDLRIDSTEPLLWWDCVGIRAGWLEIPLRGVIRVDEIDYVDPDGNTQPWTDFAVYGAGSIGATGIQPAVNTAWPAVRAQPDAVRIRVTAGYAAHPDESPAGLGEAVPASIKAALKLIVGDLYLDRETKVSALNSTAEALLNPYRAWT